MRLRLSHLIPGGLMLALGIGVVTTADRRGDQIVYALTLIGSLVGAAANAVRHRRTTWRHVANGGWLGGVLFATGVALITGDAGTVGETIGAAAVLGLIDGYGLGLVCRGMRAFEGAPQEQEQAP